jgi:hypothetical protein
MDVDGGLALQTEDQTARTFELALRQTLYRWRHMRADMVVEPVIDVPKVIRSTGFGVRMEETTLATDPHNEIVSHEYVDQLRDDDAVERIRAPEVELDAEATAEIKAKAHEAFDGILGVRMQGWLPSFELWDDIVYWRGAQPVLYDLAARPEHMHAIASRYTDARLAMLDPAGGEGPAGLRAGTHPLHRCLDRRVARARLRRRATAGEGPVDLRHGADPAVGLAGHVRGVRGLLRGALV